MPMDKIDTAEKLALLLKMRDFLWRTRSLAGRLNDEESHKILWELSKKYMYTMPKAKLNLNSTYYLK